jgi:hypothetical protein
VIKIQNKEYEFRSFFFDNFDTEINIFLVKEKKDIC